MKIFKNLIKNFFIFFLILIPLNVVYGEDNNSILLKNEWSFKGLTGKFDRLSLQRGYQVYTEACSTCHSIKYLSYRNLTEKGGPEFSIDEAKAIAASAEVIDGPNDNGEMFTRPGRLSDKFVNPYPNIESAKLANGGAHPPDMSVLVKARKGGPDYIYSLLLGYTEVPTDFKLDDGVYYNKYMEGNSIKMPKVLYDDLVTYGDGTKATEEQMAKDVVTFLTWAAEPHLESRHKTGITVIIYLIILTILVYFSMKRVWSNAESKK